MLMVCIFTIAIMLSLLLYAYIHLFCFYIKLDRSIIWLALYFLVEGRRRAIKVSFLLDPGSSFLVGIS